MIPPPSKMDMTGDQASNWEFFKDSWKNYATATKLDQKDKKIVAATLLWVKNAFISAEISLWSKKKDKMLMLSSQSLTNILYLNEIRFMNGMYSTVVLRNLVKAFISSWPNFANLPLRASSVHLKINYFVTASSLVCEITDTANVSYGKLRLLFKKPSIFVVQMK